MDGGVYPWAMRRDFDDYTVVVVANLTLDPWPLLAITLSRDGRALERIERLTAGGEWESCEPAEREGDEAQVRLTFDAPIAPNDMVVYALWG